MQIIFLIGLILLCLFYINNRYKKIDLMDLFVIGSVLFFALYPITDIINGSYKSDGIIFITTYVYIFISITLTILFTRIILSETYLKKIRLRYIIDKYQNVPQKYITILFIISLSILVYYYSYFNLLFLVDETDRVTQNITTYVTILNNIVLPINSAITLLTSIKIFNSDRVSKNYFVLNTILLVIISAYFIFLGRRAFVLHVLIVGMIWVVSRDKSLFNLKTLSLILLSIFISLIASNIYQNVRNDVLKYNPGKTYSIGENLGEKAFDFKATFSNVFDRSSPAPLLSTTIEKIQNTQPLRGVIFVQSLENAIPNVIYQNKEYINADYLLATSIGIPKTDYPSNIYTFFWADFGIFGLVFLPLFLTLFYFLITVILYLNKNNPIIFLLIFVLVIKLSLNSETTITTYITTIRLIVMYSIFGAIISKIFSVGFNKKLANSKFKLSDFK